ncbi:MAG: hybrid sensor histidine kinase/response regulator [Desulfuromonas sp.]|nr:MAG: hybrid sensor histidine kinase/response regulator [Desulfuromonas sp.]
MTMPETILVIDDERGILELTQMLLESQGYEVLTASDAIAGLELIEKHSPALVLLDYMMPVMDGFTALREIRERFPRSYVVMFTGKGSEEIAVELMKAGASDYLRKPFGNQELLERISTVLKLRRIELHNMELRTERERLLREVEEWNLELECRVDEKSRELEKAQAEIIQAEKLATFGHISAGLAHEIRNPLNSISLFSQLLQSDLQDNDDQLESIGKIMNEVDRIDNLLVKLLAASKQTYGEFAAVHVDKVIGEVLGTIKDKAEAQGVTLLTDMAGKLSPLWANRDEIEQIFTNLLTNSLQAMENGGTLQVAVSEQGENLHIVVSDDGCGIPEAHFGKIFDPFFTTKSKGTGFGLSVVLRIVKTCHGHIDVESNPEQGTTFTIRLPLQPPTKL